MTLIDVNVVAFGLLAGAFALMGYLASRKQRAPVDYLHEESLPRNIISLTATNVTLGTGLVYLMSGAQHNGLLMLAIPFATWTGYELMARLVESATGIAARTGKNVLAGLQDEIVAATGRASPFAKVTTICLVSVFLLVLAFEIFAASKVLSPFLLASPTPGKEAALSLGIFAVTLFYSVVGGVRGVFRVDSLQVPLVLVFIAILVSVVLSDALEAREVVDRLGASWNVSGIVVTSIALACVNAVATQFYSILNWGAISHVRMVHQQRLLRWVGALTAVIVFTFIVVGLLHQTEAGGQAWQSIMAHCFEICSRGGVIGYTISVALVLGMGAILLTTADAVVITAILFWYDNIAGGNSRSKRQSRPELRKIRLLATAAFVASFVVLLILNYWQPDPFYFLLSLAGGIAIFAPMIALCCYLSSRRGGLRVMRPIIVYAYLLMFLSAGTINVLLMAKRSPLVGMVGISSILVSGLFSLILLWRGVSLLKSRKAHA